MQVFSSVILFILIFAVVYEVKRSIRSNGKYDERQLIEQGRAFKKAFYAVMLLDAAVILLYAFGYSIMTAEVLAGLHIYLGLVVFATICVIKDAYFAGSNIVVKLYPLLLAVIGIANLIGGIIRAKAEPIIADGMLTNACFGLLIGVSFTFLSIVYAVKIYMAKQVDDE